MDDDDQDKITEVTPEMEAWIDWFLGALASGDKDCYMSSHNLHGTATIDGRFDLCKVRAELESRGCKFPDVSELVRKNATP